MNASAFCILREYLQGVADRVNRAGAFGGWGRDTPIGRLGPPHSGFRQKVSESLAGTARRVIRGLAPL